MKWFDAAPGTDFHVSREGVGDVSGRAFSPGQLEDPQGVL